MKSAIDREVQAMKIRPTDGPLGAYVLDVTLSELPIGGEGGGSDRCAIREALWQHHVLVFPEQNLTETDQVEFSRILCDPVAHPTNHTNVGTLPEISLISNAEEDGKAAGALGNDEVHYHSDLAFRPVPGSVSVLYAVEAPGQSGFTSWASGVVAWEALDGDSRARFSGCKVKYSHLREEYRAGEQVSHPLHVAHPESGAQSFYFSAGHADAIGGEIAVQSEMLSRKLRAYTTHKCFVWTHHSWRPRDLAAWDNRTTQHRRSSIDPSRRRFMRRTQGVGTPGHPVVA